MAQIRFANNVSTQLTKPVTASDSTITVRSLTQGLTWPNISEAGDYFLIVIDDVESSYWEILKCTNVSISDNSTTLTVERGLEGTTPSEFQAGSIVENRLTAGTLDTFGEGFPSVVELTRGGTGATTASQARTNLDVPSKADLTSEVKTRTSEVSRLDQKIIDNIPPAATTSVRGTTILSSAVDSVSEAMAATPKAVKTAYDAAISATSAVDALDAKVTDDIATITSNIETVQSSCAPTSHASSSTTYGLATDTNYGHVRSDGDTTKISAGEVVVKDVAIGGDAADLASDRGQIGDIPRITEKYPNLSSFDDAVDSGDYFCMTADMSASNAPSAIGGMLRVVAYETKKYIRQIFYIYRRNGILQRYYNAEDLTNPWSDWEVIICGDNLATSSTPGIVKPGTGMTVDAAGALNVDTASTSKAGIVQLNNTVTSTSTTLAATASAVKTAYDKAVDAADAAANAGVVGEYKAAHLESIPGYLLCNGAEVSRTTYAKLFAVIGTTFGTGDNSTTFNIPDFRRRTFWGADNNIGEKLSAGLPNITGTLSAFRHHATNTTSGVFTWTQYADTFPSYASEGARNGYYSMDAQRANSIYGASTTVQPPAISVNIFIKY